MLKEVRPRLAFQRLFGDPDQKEAARDKAKQRQYDKSILDLVREDADRLKKRLGGADREKLGEYFDAHDLIRPTVALTQTTAKSLIAFIASVPLAYIVRRRHWANGGNATPSAV